MIFVFIIRFEMIDVENVYGLMVWIFVGICNVLIVLLV